MSTMIQRLATIVWLWGHTSARRALSNPVRAVAVVLSVALATTLLAAVSKACLASVDSFEESLGLGAFSSSAIVSPVGGRLELRDFERCFGPVAPYADVQAVRREPGLLLVHNELKSVSVAGVGGYQHGSQRNQEFNHQALLSLKTIQSLSLRNGDRFELQVTGRSFEFLVATATAGSSHEGADVLVPLDTLGKFDALDAVVLSPGGAAHRVQPPDVSTFISDIGPFLRSCIGSKTALRIETPASLLSRKEQLLAAYRMNILIMALVTLLVCGLLISQATHVSMRLVLRELSILRTLGVSGTTCFTIVVVEAALLTLFGALLGCFGGYPIALRLTNFLVNTAQEIYQVSMQPFDIERELMLGVVLVIGITLFGGLSAAIAARSVIKLPPYRGTRREQVHNHPLKPRSVIAATVLSSIICALSLACAETMAGAAIAYASVVAAIVWVASSAPLAMFAVVQAMSLLVNWLSIRIARGALTMAARHFVLSAIAAALAIALMTGLTLMVFSFHGTLMNWSATRLAGDLFISTALTSDGNEGRIEQDKLEKVRSASLASAVVPYFETSTEMLGQSVVVGGVDLKLQCRRAVYTFTQGACISQDESWSDRAIVSENAARKLFLHRGSSILVDGHSFTVEGIVQEFGTERPLIVIDEKRFNSLYPQHNPKTITIDLHEPHKRDDARKWLNSLAPELLVVRDNAELRSLVETLFSRTFRVTESVRWIVFALAVLGLVSTSAQYIWERRRDCKTALVLGVSKETLTVSAVIEAAVVAVASCIVGLLGGTMIGWCLTSYINPQVFGWSLTFALSTTPCVEALLFVVCVCLITWIVASLVLGKISRGVRLADE
jgi:ABC-type antimicrobial peptide transport system permease subunit